MNTRIFRAALCLGLASAFSLSATAAPGSLAKLDLNGDTYIDKTEFLSAANQRFANMDADANGAVTKDERKAFKAQKREERAERRFERGDANADGFISRQEFETARAERDQKREAVRTKRKETRELRDADRSDRKSRRGDKERFKRDANNDGVIDVAEHTAAAEHAFARMDKNNDGLLSQDEMKRKKRRGNRKHRRSDR